MTRFQRTALWMLTGAAVLLLLPASYMTWSVFQIWGQEPSSAVVLAYGALWTLTAALCLLGPALAWRSIGHGRVGRAFGFAILPLIGLISVLLLVAWHVLMPLP